MEACYDTLKKTQKRNTKMAIVWKYFGLFFFLINSDKKR